MPEVLGYHHVSLSVSDLGKSAEWYRQAFYHIDHTYRRGVKAVIFFNQPTDITISPSFPLNVD